MRVLGRMAMTLVIAILLLLSARYVLSAPLRISVLPSLTVDASAYDAIALDLSNTWSLDAIPPLQPPGFVTFLAVVFTVFGHSWTAGRLALWACLIVATALSALVAKTIYRSETAGWGAALLCTASPALRGYAGTLQYELLAAVFLLVLIWTAWRVTTAAPSPRQIAAVAACGLGIGLAVLTREVFVAVIPVVAVYLYARLSTTGPRRRAAAIMALYLACAAGPPLAWSALQSTRTGRVVALSDKGPLVLAFGNNPAANGTFNAPLAGVPDPSGWAFIRTHPRQAAWLAMRKVLYFWGTLRDGWNVPRPSAFVVARAAGGVLPLQWILPWARGGWLLVLVLIALVGWPREMWARWWLVPATIAAVMTVHIVTVSSHRFAVPVLPLVFALGAGPLANLAMTIWHAGRTRAAVAAAFLFVTLMQLGSWTLAYELNAWDLDGFAAENRLDERSGVAERFADPAHGRRAVLLLADEYFPAGGVNITVSARIDGEEAQPSAALFRVALTTNEGHVACERIVTADDLDRKKMSSVVVPCELAVGGPSIFVVETLARAPVTFGGVRFVWGAL